MNFFRVSIDGVSLDDQLRSFEIHEFPLGRFDPLLCVYVKVKWGKYDASSHLSLYCESAG